MKCGKTYYSIDKLRFGMAGDVLRVLYDSGDIVVATADATAEPVIKTELNRDPAHLFNPDAGTRLIRLSTCDSALAKRTDGHAEYNSVQTFRVVEVISSAN